MLQKSNYQNFLDQFTEEVILVLVAALREEELEKIEQTRADRRIEEEKFKIKIFPQNRENNPQQLRSIKNTQRTSEISQFSNMQPSISAQLTQNQPIQKNQQVITREIEQISPIQQKPLIQPRTREIQPININAPQNTPQLQPGEINFGKIIFLVKDPFISYIECPGEGQNVIIKKSGQTMKTQIILTKEEMITIIKDFSGKTRIPLIEGLLNARYENLELSAVVSEIITPSFIIRKNIPAYSLPQNRYQPRF